jgi:hypothetical protein
MCSFKINAYDLIKLPLPDSTDPARDHRHGVRYKLAVVVSWVQPDVHAGWTRLDGVVAGSCQLAEPISSSALL